MIRMWYTDIQSTTWYLGAFEYAGFPKFSQPYSHSTMTMMLNHWIWHVKLELKNKVEVSQKEYGNSCLLLIISDDVKYWNYTRKGTDSIGVYIYIYVYYTYNIYIYTHLALPATFSHSCGDFQVASRRPLLQDGSHCRAGLKRPSSCGHVFIWKIRFEFEPIGIGG